jgi:RNase P subunit RPR2
MMRPASLLKSSKRVFFVTFRLARILCNGCIAVLCPCINSESNTEKKIDNVFKILCACRVFSRKKYPVGSERHWFFFYLGGRRKTYFFSGGCCQISI